MFSAIEILQEFVEAQSLGSPPRLLDELFVAASDPEAMRAAYRASHDERGLCRACPAPAEKGVKYCARHRAIAKRSAKASYLKHRDRQLAEHRARRAKARAEREAASDPRSLTERRTDAGVCTKCGKAPASKERRQCWACREANSTRRVRPRATARAYRCSACGGAGHNRRRCAGGQS